AAGRSSTDVTVTPNDRLADSDPSETVTVIVVVPWASAAGVAVTVRLEPEPPRARPEFGTTAVLDDIAVTERLDAELSGSDTVNPIAPVGVSSAVEVLAMAVRDGASLTAATVMDTVAVLLSPS